MKRVTLCIACIVLLCCSIAHADQFLFELRWGFGPTPSEIYWDGTVRASGGRVVEMDAVSFERDRHDRSSPPSFQSLTVNDGWDGLNLTVDGDEQTAVRIQSKEGTFEWTVGQLRREGKITLPSRSRGKLTVRLKEFLGDVPRLLSDKRTQDSHPAVCRLQNGDLVVLCRAFVGLPTPQRVGGDQIRGVVLDSRGRPGASVGLLARPGDVESVAIASEGASASTAVWAEQRDHNWDLYATLLETGGGTPGRTVQRSGVTRLTQDPGVDRSPALVASGDSLVLAWQGWRNGRSEIHARFRREGVWGESALVSAGPGNAWNPVVAGKGGTAAVAWSTWRNGSYDVQLRVHTSGGWSRIVTVAASERFEAHPSLAYDEFGTLWVAYEKGRIGWGMDSHSAGLRSERNVALRLYRNGKIEEPVGTAALALAKGFENRSEMAHLARDGRGVLWLLFRSLEGPGVWRVYGCSLGDDGWSVPAALRSAAGGQNVKLASVTAATGQLLVVWPSDHRTSQVANESYLYASLLPKRKGRTPPVNGREVISRITAESERQPPSTRPTITLGDRKLKLFLGDLHRHTELSVCRTGSDGSLDDAQRYAIDAAGLDFLCVTDHVQHVKILNDYDYWRTGKTADLHRVPGVHQPFYGYERSQRWPFGHRNVIGLKRHPKRVPRTADNRPSDANRGYPGEVRVTPPELWSQLVGQNVITIPHTTGNPVMGTSFGHRPPAIEPVVEIYQGCRISYEHASAPDPRRTRDGGRFGGATKAGGFIWDALAKGYRYGFIASSDHAATHNSYTCVWAEEFSNAAILEALSKRRCYAATDEIVCDARMGAHLMGAEIKVHRVPPLDVAVFGTGALERIDVVKDNRVVFTHQPERKTEKAHFVYRDLDATPGSHYYYVRVLQADRKMAWVSPIWIDLEKGE